MIRRAILITCMLLLVGLFSAGCKDQEPAEQAGSGVGSMDQYRKQAEEKIDEGNAEDELRKLQEEIDADVGGE